LNGTIGGCTGVITGGSGALGGVIAEKITNNTLKIVT
jgi:hypothetical protein